MRNGFDCILELIVSLLISNSGGGQLFTQTARRGLREKKQFWHWCVPGIQKAFHFLIVDFNSTQVQHDYCVLGMLLQSKNCTILGISEYRS